jgi:hypothetical protein
MPMDPIGPRPAGMDKLEPASEADVKGAQGPETAGRTGGEDHALRADDRPEASPPKLAEAGGERLGETKFHGMRVRENLQSSALDPALYHRPAESMESSGAKADPSIRVNENLRQPGTQNIWGESVKSDPARQGKLDIHDQLHASQPAASMIGHKLEGQADAFVRVSENLHHAGSQNIWGESVKSPAAPLAKEDPSIRVSDNLRQPEAQKIWGESVKTPSPRQERMEIHENLVTPQPAASLVGNKLEGRAVADAELNIQEELHSPNQVASVVANKLEGRAEAKAELEVHEDLKLENRSWAGVGAKPKTGAGD